MSLFAIGLGYSARRLIERGRLGPAAGTARTLAAVEAWRGLGVEAFLFAGAPFEPRLADALRGAHVVLVSVPPDAAGDPALRTLSALIFDAGVGRIVYLSTVGVYAEVGGAWVDETSPTATIPRAVARLEAEAGWRDLGDRAGVPVDVLRLAGIYGPGRSAFDRLRDGTARRVIKPGQVFNRIHVEDIAGAIEAVVAARRPGAVYNVADGAPAPPEDVIAHAAQLIGVAAPPEEPFATARLSGMSRSFYESNRRIRPDKLREIGWTPVYLTYREGLEAIMAQERQA
jgi:nucleoside-diphosphate-sugar epimerase